MDNYGLFVVIGLVLTIGGYTCMAVCMVRKKKRIAHEIRRYSGTIRSASVSARLRGDIVQRVYYSKVDLGFAVVELEGISRPRVGKTVTVYGYRGRYVWEVTQLYTSVLSTVWAVVGAIGTIMIIGAGGAMIR